MGGTSLSQDNHLRALVLAFVSPYFSHTETDHAQLVGVKWTKCKLRKWGGAEAKAGGSGGRKCAVEALGWGVVCGHVICPLSFYLHD